MSRKSLLKLAERCVLYRLNDSEFAIVPPEYASKRKAHRAFKEAERRRLKWTASCYAVYLDDGGVEESSASATTEPLRALESWSAVESLCQALKSEALEDPPEGTLLGVITTVKIWTQETEIRNHSDEQTLIDAGIRATLLTQELEK